jgi:hypothetical protein
LSENQTLITRLVSAVACGSFSPPTYLHL